MEELKEVENDLREYKRHLRINNQRGYEAIGFKYGVGTAPPFVAIIEINKLIEDIKNG
tara:strand:+ start:90 stop:263 length:174 start_codon:yes stop_codon:yes gene_type:complete